MRFFRMICAVGVLAGVFAAGASGFGFTDEAQLPPDLQLGSPYTFQLSARNGCPPYYYEQQSGAFPPGVSMTRDGLISGTAAMGGTYQTWLAVKNQCPGDSSERLFTFYVVDPQPLVVRTSQLTAAVEGAYYQSELLSSESGVLTWTVNGGQLPAGLKLSNNGQLMGIPTAFGASTFRVKVNDGRRTATSELTLVVSPRLALVAKTLRLGVGRSFHTRVVVRGGLAPLRWAIVSGRLPRGVRFVAGEFRGRPQAAGTFRVAVKVTDAASARSTRTFVLVVRR